jgi:hypothetical protein
MLFFGLRGFQTPGQPAEKLCDFRQRAGDLEDEFQP